MNTGDHNSGWHFVKYPIYSDEDAGKREADYNEIRLAEIYYSLAECKFKANDVDGAAKLLNALLSLFQCWANTALAVRENPFTVTLRILRNTVWIS